MTGLGRAAGLGASASGVIVGSVILVDSVSSAAGFCRAAGRFITGLGLAAAVPSAAGLFSVADASPSVVAAGLEITGRLITGLGLAGSVGFTSSGFIVSPSGIVGLVMVGRFIVGRGTGTASDVSCGTAGCAASVVSEAGAARRITGRGAAVTGAAFGTSSSAK